MTRGFRFPALAMSTVLTTVALTACSATAPEEVDSATVVPVTAEPAQTGSIRAVIHATGTVSPAPGAEFIIVAPEPARIAEMPKGEGERVAAGDLLVRFEIPSASAEAGRQRAEVARAQAQLENARAAQTRARDLFGRGIAARKEMEDADRDVADAQAALAQADAALEAATTLAARATVRAPFNGIVAKRLHNPGDNVEAAAADPVLRVIDPRRLEVIASVPIADVRRIVIGAAARLTNAGAGQQVALRVISRPATVEPGTASAPVRLAFPAAATYPMGTPVEIDIDAEEHTGVVLVPSTAIVREAEETAIFIAEGEKAVRRPVTTGIADQEHVEVTSGAKAGELVITRGQAGLPDGAAITLDGADRR